MQFHAQKKFEIILLLSLNAALWANEDVLVNTVNATGEWDLGSLYISG